MDLKKVRGQLRQIVKEILPDMLTQAFKDAAYKKLEEDMTLRIRALEKNVKDSLDILDQRSKDTLGYLVRQVSLPPPAPGQEQSSPLTLNEAPTNEQAPQ